MPAIPIGHEIPAELLLSVMLQRALASSAAVQKASESDVVASAVLDTGAQLLDQVMEELQTGLLTTVSEGDLE